MKFFYLGFVVFFLSLNLRPSITSVGPLLDIIQKDLGMSGVTASLITTLPVLCMGLFALLSITLSQRFGLERALFVSMVMIFAATAFRAAVNDSVSLLATALISGIGIGIAGPLLSGFIKKHFPGRPGATSIYSVSLVIGAAVASSLSIPIFEGLHQSWQYALCVWAGLAVIAAGLLLPLTKEKAAKSELTRPSLRVKNGRMGSSMVFFGCMSSMFYMITAWLAPLVQSAGISHEQSGLVLTLFTIIQIPISFFVPVIVSRTGKRNLWLVICALSELIGVALLLAHLSPWLATVFLGIGAGGLFPLALLIPIQEAESATEATSWSAAMQCGGYMLGCLGPMLIGLTVDVFGNFTVGLIVMLFIIGCLLWSISRLGGRKQVVKRTVAT
ncbi:MFS transporter [Brevibacillus parabrevis]|uniref:MFS transporter n=1 Tax=Brevibacillus parabrevis TaxID=54914 RepID=UPI002E1E167D|nr:MFS transporter [Brevibacillus parabrevis]MED2256430.1 MFS transporter [Brevibacillus parabrevis]